MNKITTLFQNRQRNIVSIYFTAGFPQLNDTIEIIKELQINGIDMIEVGVPFSDPIADGKVIQASSYKAIQNGMNLKILFKQLEAIKSKIQIPLIIMSYLNPIIQYGFENFCEDCHKIDISGIIIPDLPFEEYINEYKFITDAYDLKMIMLISPKTSEERIRLIDSNVEGFIYMVSSAATTGIQESFDEQKQEYFRRINSMKLRNPRLIGFGISNKETLTVALENASGVIIGSKFVSLLAEENNPQKAVQKLLAELK
ncbi:MAG: tryptophan synthase subunit alpha [Candidatus Azobacteroides pseudotrichonymphae]|jgi:tryptophan synthase alpha chain|nr:tryptophan synthase subunit alpha [Bacteroidales bacterium OttesenSCG-928-I14]GMO32143.1 MAG: tryptophan synthase subunit alpha [Candidatus Azobacteroides pseudotrichonymphae]